MIDLTVLTPSARLKIESERREDAALEMFNKGVPARGVAENFGVALRTMQVMLKRARERAYDKR